MPTVAIVGQYQFVIRTREFDFEPPHVHVRVGNEDWARILLDNGEYSHEPPPGHYRAILEAFDIHAATIREEWFRIHARVRNNGHDAGEKCRPDDGVRFRAG